MSDFLLSATLHGVVVALILLLSYAANQQVKNMPHVLDLVAGEGDNYMASVAPALGTPGGVKLDVPTSPVTMPKPEPAVVEPAPAPAVPLQAVPTPAPTKAVPAPSTSFVRQIRNKVIRAESKAKQEIAKEHKAEAKRLEDEKKKLTRMTKEEFDKFNRSNPATKTAPTKVARIDAEGIAKGVAGGSTDNKVGGAGGKALASDNDDVLAAYYALFKQRLTRMFDPPPGLSDTLEVKIQARSNADGSIVSAKVVKSSGSAEFDRAVMAAVSRVKMPARPDRGTELFAFDFSMRDKEDY